MSAAALVDNLLVAECAIIPTASSQVRALASLGSQQQVEIWQLACTHSFGKVPTANLVRKARAEFLGEPEPSAAVASQPLTEDETLCNNQTPATATPAVTKSVILPQPSALLSSLKSRVKGTKASLRDVEVMLELVLEMTQEKKI